MTEVTLAHPIITGFWLSIGFMLPGIVLSGAGLIIMGVVIGSFKRWLRRLSK
jgi:hypothetical protein